MNHANPAPDDLVRQAQRHVRHGEHIQAIELFDRALEDNPDRIEAHEGLATAAFLIGDLELAVTHFTRAAQLAPRQGRPLINLGAIYNRMGEHQKAADVLRKGLQRDRKSSEGYYNLGIAHRALNQASLAVSAYREAVRLNPQMAEAHQNLANVYLEMGNHQQAIAHYQKALEIAPGFERARRGLARAEQAADEARQTISPFGRLVKEAPPGTTSRDTQPIRRLSDQERLEDRRELARLADDAWAATQRWLDHLRDELEPLLLSLSREVAQSPVPPSLITTHEDFQRGLAQSAELRRQLRRVLLELRAHEELMNTPDPIVLD